MLHRILAHTALSVGLLLTAGSAHALTVDGTQYNQILDLSSVNASDRIGYWVSMDKFYTYELGQSGAKAIDVNRVSSDPALASAGITDVLAMGTTIGDNGPVNSGNVNFFGAGGALLLSTAIIPNGTISSTRINGQAGQLSIGAKLAVTGGSLAGLALFADPLYIQIVFENVVGLGGGDVHLDTGNFRLFSAPSNTAVPEPGSVALLLTGLAGLSRARRKRAAVD